MSEEKFAQAVTSPQLIPFGSFPRANKRDIFWCYGGRLRGGSPPCLKFMKGILATLPFQDMEPDVYKGDGRNLFCLAKSPDVYLYFMTPAWKDHGKLFVGPVAGSRYRYEATVYDAWNCRKAFEATWTCGVAKGLELPRYAAIVLRRKRGT